MMSFDRNYKDSRILVTGGAGFIGFHLSERLLAAGAEVVCADNYFTGSRKTGEDCTGPINLGNNSEFTILELAEKVISYTNSRSKLIFKPLPQDDPRQRQPDLSKAKTLLN